MKLETNLEKLNLSLSAAKMGTWEWDLANDRLIWDDRMYSIHSVDPKLSDVLRDQIKIKIIAEDYLHVRSKLDSFVAHKQDFNISYRIRGANKEIRYIKTFAKFHPDHNILYGVAWDFTDEMQTESDIADAKAKLISSAKMAALGEMSGGIAHEINNPLTVIQARAFQLNQMVENNRLDPEKIKHAADSISQTADKIAKIIKSLRSFAREGNQDAFEFVPVKKIVEDTLEFCKTRFYNYGVDVELDELDPDLEIECRLIQIEQVLLNLLNNSFDAIQKMDRKWIRVSVIDLEEEIEIRVTDSGQGISIEIAERIMHPFFTTKEIGKGTGLGLSISSGIVKFHNGSLALDQQCKNTCFVLRLPKLQPSGK